VKAGKLNAGCRAIVLGLAVLMAAFGVGPSGTPFGVDGGAKAAADGDPLQLQVKSAILIEAETGQVLYEKNADEPLPPASMAKMMTEYLVLDAIRSGNLKWEDTVVVSQTAAATGGSGSLIAAGETFTVRKLFEDMSIYSGNRSSVALAERIAGSEKAFVDRMNEMARKLGLSERARFVNATGLPGPMSTYPAEGETMLSARDVAALARRLVLDHPEVLDFTKIPQLKFRETDRQPMVNWNWMLEANASVPEMKPYAYVGLDGLKTGHTDEAGYCFTGTAVRDGMRLISVVMGANTRPASFSETRKLLDYGFATFEVRTLVEADVPLDAAGVIPVRKGKKTELRVAVAEPVRFVVRKDDRNPQPEIELKPKPERELVAPIRKGDAVGTATVRYGGAERTVTLVAAEDVEKAGWFRLFWRSVREFFADLFGVVAKAFKG